LHRWTLFEPSQFYVSLGRYPANSLRLILTPVNEPRRSLSQNLRALPSYFCPVPLMVPTILYSMVDPAISRSTPLILRSRLAIDPVLTPTSYSLCKFMSRTLELFVKLPLETVLRRGQASVLASREYSTGEHALKTTIEAGPFRGVVGTMWSIMREEGSRNRESVADGVKAGITRKKANKKGQGLEGLWRGWRVGMWGLVGVWGASAIGGSGNAGGEF
jgi:fusion and transport protein UGO1